MNYYLNKAGHNSIQLILIIILVLSSAAKIIVFNNIYHSDPEKVYQVDSSRYTKPALSLLHKGTLAINPKSIDTSALQIAPAYPAFIAASYYIFGKSHYPLILIQILISTLSIWLVYLIACKLWAQQTGLIAAALMALDPLQFFYAQVILTETLFNTMFMLFILFSIYLLVNNEHRYRNAILLGLSLAAATMVRPTSYYLIFPIIIGIISYSKSINLNSKQMIHVPLLILASFFIIIGSWQIRNGELVGSYIFTDNISSLGLKYKAAGVIALEEDISNEQAYEQILQTLPEDYSSFSEKFETRKEKLSDILSNHKLSYLKLSLQNLPSLLLGPGFDDQGKYYVGNKYTQRNEFYSSTTSTFMHQLQLKTHHSFWFLCLMVFSVLYLCTLYISFFYGVAKSINSTKAMFTVHMLMFGILIYFIILSTGNTFSYSRIRVPLMPLFILYSSYGIQLLIHTYYNIRKKTGIDSIAINI